MIYTVSYVRNKKEEVHSNLSKMEAGILASYIRQTFRLDVKIDLQEKVVVKAK